MGTIVALWLWQFTYLNASALFCEMGNAIPSCLWDNHDGKGLAPVRPRHVVSDQEMLSQGKMLQDPEGGGAAVWVGAGGFREE